MMKIFYKRKNLWYFTYKKAVPKINFEVDQRWELISLQAFFLHFTHATMPTEISQKQEQKPSRITYMKKRLKVYTLEEVPENVFTKQPKKENKHSNTSPRNLEAS